MKKVLAIILSIAMLFGVLAMNTFAETTQPTITIDCGEAVKVGETTTINVKLTNFSSVKGMDLTVTASTTGVKFTAVTCEEIELKLKDNYTLADQKLHIVDLNSVDTATIAITATVTAAANVTAAAELAKDGTTLFAANEFTVVGDDVVINTVEMEGTENGTVEAPVELKSNEDEGYFIPYGSVYVKDGDSYKYIDKDDNGVYNITESNVNWKKFPIPDGGFGTFAFSTSLNAMTTPAVQFATYSNKYATATKHGTMLIAGDWTEFKAKYAEKYSESELVEKLSGIYDSNIGENDYVTVTFNSAENSIRVRKVDQNNFMWRNSEVLEYALRVNGLTANDDYAAVGYYEVDSTTNFSATVMSYTYTVEE